MDDHGVRAETLLELPPGSALVHFVLINSQLHKVDRVSEDGGEDDCTSQSIVR